MLPALVFWAHGYSLAALGAAAMHALACVARWARRPLCDLRTSHAGPGRGRGLDVEPDWMRQALRLAHGDRDVASSAVRLVLSVRAVIKSSPSFCTTILRFTATLVSRSTASVREKAFGEITGGFASKGMQCGTSNIAEPSATGQLRNRTSAARHAAVRTRSSVFIPPTLGNVPTSRRANRAGFGVEVRWPGGWRASCGLRGPVRVPSCAELRLLPGGSASL